MCSILLSECCIYQLAPYPAEIAPTRIPDRVLIIDASSSADILKLLGE